MNQSIIGPGQGKVIRGAWTRLRDVIRPREYSPKSHASNMGYMRGRYKARIIEFYYDRNGFYEVRFVGVSNATLRKELRKLAGMKT